jgi:hypothetical protein
MRAKRAPDSLSGGDVLYDRVHPRNFKVNSLACIIHEFSEFVNKHLQT